MAKQIVSEVDTAVTDKQTAGGKVGGLDLAHPEELLEFGIDYKTIPPVPWRLRWLFFGMIAASSLMALSGILRALLQHEKDGAYEFAFGAMLVLFAPLIYVSMRNELRMERVAGELLVKLREERARAVAASDKRHAFNRDRERKAIEFYKSNAWTSTAEAGRAIGERFHVEPRVAERWIRKSLRNKGDSAQDGDRLSTG